jgi:hypothetical protein
MRIRIGSGSRRRGRRGWRRRGTPLREASRGKLLIMALAFMLLGGGAMAIAGKLFLEEAALDREGVPALGRVTHTYVDTRRDSDGQVTTTYHARFTYTTDRGESVEADKQIPRSWFDKLKAGDSFQVTYLPERPAVVRIEGAGSRMAPFMFGLLGAVFFGLGLWLLVYRSRRAERAVRPSG